MNATEQTTPVIASAKSGQNLMKEQSSMPKVFDYKLYREFLAAFITAKKAANPSYTASLFTKRAGLGPNSRGYLKMVIEGKRNLTPKTIRAFAEAMNLQGQESLYFENLVLFNQADNQKDKKFYFDRLSAASQGQNSEQVELLHSEYRFYAHWYVAAVQQLVALSSFSEDPTWIVKTLKGKITREEAIRTLNDLLNLKLIERNADGKLVQTQSMVHLSASVFSEFIQSFHSGMLDRAKEALWEESFERRSTSGVTFSCKESDFVALKAEVEKFRAQMMEKFGSQTENLDSVIQVNFQIFHLSKEKEGKKL